MLTLSTLQRLWPQGDLKVPGLRAGIAAAAPSVFPRYGLTSQLTVAHAMAQFSHECGAGLEMWENLSYSASRLPEVWPKHFDASNADAYAHNPQKLANYIYEPPIHNDLGNRPNSNDGWERRGRGLSQLTGLDSDKRVSAKTSIDIVGHPEYPCNPRCALEIAVADFVLCGCLPFAQADDIDNVTHKLNGGYIGLAERKVWLEKWKAALAQEVPEVPPVPPPVPVPAPEPPLVHPKHMTGIAVFIAGIVAALQRHEVWDVIGITIATVVIVLLLHFFWPKKG